MREERGKQIWCVYNHMPGGQMVVTHFETYKRKRKVGNDKTEEVTFTADDQLEAFKKSDFVSLKIKGKDAVKNDVITFPPNTDLPKDPAPAVFAYAFSQGMEPIRSAEEKKAMPVDKGRVQELESQVTDLQAQLKASNEVQQQILEQLKKLSGAPVVKTGSEVPHAG